VWSWNVFDLKLVLSAKNIGSHRVHLAPPFQDTMIFALWPATVVPVRVHSILNRYHRGKRKCEQRERGIPQSEGNK
jgi:hypothetical protein